MSKNSPQLIKIRNASGVAMSVTNFGARVVSLSVPDKQGKLDDIVLGFDTLTDYLKHDSYFGAVIGRYANRIAKGKFSLNGNNHQLVLNNGAHALHGGHTGFHKAFWGMIPFKENSVLLTYRSKNGEEEYPGNVDVTVTYTLTDENELVIEYEATTDQETIINLTHHSFFNLAGAGNGDVLNHELMINANEFTSVDDQLIPIGELKNVKGTAFDFTAPHRIGERIAQGDEQLKFGNGYDHNWVLNKIGSELSLAAKVAEPKSGRTMEVWTTEPGLQFYSGNFPSNLYIGKGNRPYLFRSAFCLEPQHFPDSPNHPNFPSTILKPGETYRQKSVYRFGISK